MQESRRISKRIHRDEGTGLKRGGVKTLGVDGQERNHDSETHQVDEDGQEEDRQGP